jgi:hypothetical protein
MANAARMAVIVATTIIMTAAGAARMAVTTVSTAKGPDTTA